ncbi:LINE-1 retrotransposable element ORF2 protein [Cucumis melo var. makuwa]|uniref:LINE-1 retrotransposable element ORF2 protein n=1 Tax=Cucumis melo var. makuwa TaxID=1194695 RepID=A0A5A7UMZ5_CUCMM|nr:LINE-1 retrotransposable element ORF2 protein [Cucumis melo var. makuwa]TYK22730.1 LINE-1 retrotransposable element ORF2 protein [Cucumis melo var. makuwa]
MINSSLANLLTYQLSVFKAPKACYERKLNPVSWKISTFPKEKCGLGITPIEDTNFALLNKWLWRYHSELKALWRTFIDAKYTKSSLGDILFKSRFSSTNAP